MHAPGEGTRPPTPWLGLNERGFGTLVDAKGTRRSGAAVLSPLPGLGFHGGTEPSAHALGYHLAALRACCHGLGPTAKGERGKGAIVSVAGQREAKGFSPMAPGIGI
jgi:hypothetical protein